MDELTNLIRLDEIHEVRAEKIPALIAQLAALQSALAARLLQSNGSENGSGSKDRLLTVDQAAEKLSCSADWIYRRSKTLPFVTRLGGNIRIQESAMERWIRARSGK